MTYATYKSFKRKRKQTPAKPVPCRVSSKSGKSVSFESRTKAKKYLGSLVKNLPPKSYPDEPAKYWLENV